jgi:hypothetical protein
MQAPDYFHWENRGIGVAVSLYSSPQQTEGVQAQWSKLEVYWGSETPTGAHSRGLCLSCRWDYLWIMPIRSPPAAMRFRHRGCVLPFGSGAALQPDRGRLKCESSHSGGLYQFRVKHGEVYNVADQSGHFEWLDQE